MTDIGRFQLRAILPKISHPTEGIRQMQPRDADKPPAIATAWHDGALQVAGLRHYQ
jgi:hypothetical protein